jgi:hypothetical protein
MKNINPGSKAGGTASASGPAKAAQGKAENKPWTPPDALEKPLTALPPQSLLTKEEAAELVKLEEVIRSGWTTFLEVGKALIRVRDGKLYKDEYASFEIYCQTKLGFSRPYAYNLIGSAEVSSQLSSIGDKEIKPVNEAQCRELISVPKEKRKEAWKKAVVEADGKPLTAKIIHEAVASFKPHKKNKQSKPKKVMNLKPALKLLDDIEGLADKKEPKKLLAKVNELRDWLEKHSEQ